jgi:hypothetical protein
VVEERDAAEDRRKLTEALKQWEGLDAAGSFEERLAAFDQKLDGIAAVAAELTKPKPPVRSQMTAREKARFIEANGLETYTALPWA